MTPKSKSPISDSPGEPETLLRQLADSALNFPIAIGRANDPKQAAKVKLILDSKNFVSAQFQ